MVNNDTLIISVDCYCCFINECKLIMLPFFFQLLIGFQDNGKRTRLSCLGVPA